MSLLELFFLAIGVSMDAFSVAICKGLAVKDLKLRHGLIVGAYFGGFQGLMPLLGFLLGTFIAQFVQAFDHWVILLILGFLGIQMIREAMDPESCPTGDFSPRTMLPLAIATSIDA
ncbi:MAG: manganese efflux pump, partial [Peptoniphilaceae bacterium]|nr:manganese efflux pump [Peptoniphilaceae bacterium]MDY5765620.1 manganese efflux pump [Peptoniphilaceae bacterium]